MKLVACNYSKWRKYCNILHFEISREDYGHIQCDRNK